MDGCSEIDFLIVLNTTDAFSNLHALKLCTFCDDKLKNKPVDALVLNYFVLSTYNSAAI
jgi:hypothetical protein